MAAQGRQARGDENECQSGGIGPPNAHRQKDQHQDHRRCGADSGADGDDVGQERPPAHVHGKVTAREVDGKGLTDPRVLKLARGLKLTEDLALTAEFPARRIARVTLTTKDGRMLKSPPTEALSIPTRRSGTPWSWAVLIRALVSFGKHEPPKPGPG